MSQIYFGETVISEYVVPALPGYAWLTPICVRGTDVGCREAPIIAWRIIVQGTKGQRFDLKEHTYTHAITPDGEASADGSDGAILLPSGVVVMQHHQTFGSQEKYLEHLNAKQTPMRNQRGNA